MSLFRQKSVLTAFLCVVAAVVFIGCGNKGDLYLESIDSVLPELNPIDNALDELELMEAEEEKES